ncbi:MAG: terminase family protein [Clostridia bacterium]|nr:terminase family protein [Clostridia bacterium]
MKKIIKKIKTIDNILQTREKKSTLELYNSGEKVHKKQMAFHRCLKRNRWVFGGNRTGKTECGAVETVWLARGNHPFRKNKKNVSCWVVSLSRQVQRDVAQSKILHYVDKRWIKEIVMLEGRKSSAENGIIDYILLENVFGGVSKIAFKSCDQGREKFQGASLDFVWFDEEPPEDIFKECKMRVLDKKGEIFGTMTPLKGLTWVYDMIFLNKNNDPEVWHEFISWQDNPFLDAGEVATLMATLSAEELESRCNGKFLDNGGLVYGEFDESVHVIDPFPVPLEWQDNISIDPGLHNPLSAHWYAEDFDGNIFVIAEHYEAKKSIEYHAEKIKEICASLNWHTGFGGRIEALIDSASNQRTLASTKSVSELFFDLGIAVNPRVNKDLFAGINVVKSYLKSASGETRIFIFKNCVNMIREIKGYFWGNGDAPIKRDDHAMDELRYYLMHKNAMQDKSLKKTVVQKNKESLYRKIRRENRL